MKNLKDFLEKEVFEIAKKLSAKMNLEIDKAHIIKV